MFIDGYVLIATLIAFFFLFRYVSNLNDRVDRLITTVRQLERHAPQNLEDFFDNPLVNRVSDLEEEVFCQTHPDIDFAHAKSFGARLRDLEYRVEQAGNWLRLKNLAEMDDWLGEEGKPRDDLDNLTSVVMSAGSMLRGHKENDD